MSCICCASPGCLQDVLQFVDVFHHNVSVSVEVGQSAYVHGVLFGQGYQVPPEDLFFLMPRCCFSRCSTTAEDTGDNREEDSSNHRKPTERDARGDGKAAELLASVLHKGADVFLSRRDSVVQL